MVDMSRSGIGILTALPLKAGEALRLRLEPAAAEGFELSCRVRWVRPEGRGNACGLEFERLGIAGCNRVCRTLARDGLSRADRLTDAAQDAACILGLGAVFDIVRASPALLAGAAGILPALLAAGALAGLWLALRR